MSDLLLIMLLICLCVFVAVLFINRNYIATETDFEEVQDAYRKE